LKVLKGQGLVAISHVVQNIQ